MTTEDLLSETVEAAQKREATTFDTLADATRDRIVLFGAGALGRKMLTALREVAIEPLAFVDNNPALHGDDIEGVRVFSPVESAGHWGCSAIFVVTIFRPDREGMAARLRNLSDLGCQRVTSFLPLAWALQTLLPSLHLLPHFGADLPSRLLKQADALRQVAAAMRDESSREIFRQQLAWRLRGDFSEASPPAADQYFPRDLVAPHVGEIFVDGGAFDGDTLRAIPWPILRAWAIEPDPVNLEKLKTLADDRVKICETALGSTAGWMRFNAAGTMASARARTGNIKVTVSTLDQLLGDETPTFLKLDIEGDEFMALQGAREMLERVRPAAAVCVYHRSEDLWTIPLFLQEVLPNHALALRSHAHDGFELVIYALPRERRVNRN